MSINRDAKNINRCVMMTALTVNDVYTGLRTVFVTIGASCKMGSTKLLMESEGC